MFGIEVWSILLVFAIVMMGVFIFTGRRSVIAWFILGIIASIAILLYDLLRGRTVNWTLCKQIISVLLFLGMIYQVSGDLAGYKNEDEN